MLTPFGKLMHQLRLEHGEPNLKHQAQLFNLSSTTYSHILRGSREVDPEWIPIILKEYNLTKSEYNLRLAAVSNEDPITLQKALKHPALSKFGTLFLQMCEENDLLPQEICNQIMFPSEYINYLCVSNVPPLRQLIEQFSEKFKLSDALKKAMYSCVSGDELSKKIDMRQRTLAQRILVWFLENSIYLFDKPALQLLQSVIDGAKKRGQVFCSNSTPIGIFLQELQDRYAISNKKMAEILDVTPYIWKKILSGTCVPPNTGNLDSAINGGELFRYCTEKLISVSEDYMSYYNEFDPQVSSVASVMKDFFEAVPYLSDDDVDTLMERIWMLRRKENIKRVGNRQQSFARGTCPVSPAGKFIKALIDVHGENITTFAEKINISSVETSSIIRGRSDVTYSVFRRIVSAYNMAPGCAAAFRFACDLDRRFIIMDMAPCSIKHRITAMKLHDCFADLSENEIDQILAILQGH